MGVFLCAQLLVQVYLSCCGVLACGSLTRVLPLPTLWGACTPPIYCHVLLLLEACQPLGCLSPPFHPHIHAMHACLYMAMAYVAEINPIAQLLSLFAAAVTVHCHACERVVLLIHLSVLESTECV